MKIDRKRFLALTFSLGVDTAACASKEPPRVEVPPAPQPPASTGPLAVSRADPPPAEPQTPPPSPPEACAENAVGSLAACDAWQVDPTCESGGPRSECATLIDQGGSNGAGTPDGFKPRVAQKIAECMSAKPVTRKTGCKLPDMHKCIRAGVDTVCIEPAMLERCEQITAGCKARKRGPTFTAEQCAKIASSTVGPMRDWALEAMSGVSSTGAPMSEGCTLSYVTIYQPWPANWWAGK